MTEKHEAPGISEHSATAKGAWDERYSQAGLVWGRDANSFVVSQLEGLSPRRVLDLGCGQGRNALWLASQGHEVTGLDLSPVAIAQASEIAEGAGLDAKFAAVDLVTDWQPSPDAYDLIVLSYLQLPESARKPVIVGVDADRRMVFPDLDTAGYDMESRSSSFVNARRTGQRVDS